MMLKDFIVSVLSVVFLGTVCEMIIPDGSLKKYFKLVIGFIMMSTLIYPVKNIKSAPEFEFSFEYPMSEEEIRAESDAYILKLHEETIQNRISEICGDDVKIFTEIFSDGTIKEITLRGNVSKSEIDKIIKETGCKNIKAINGD